MPLTHSQERPEFELNLELGRTLRSKRIKREMNNQDRQGKQRNHQRAKLFGELFKPRFDVTQWPLEVEVESCQIPQQVIGLMQQWAIF